MWSLSAPWGAFGGMVAKDWKERERSTEEMYGHVYGAVSQVLATQAAAALVAVCRATAGMR